jgi:hypothetical protein
MQTRHRGSNFATLVSGDCGHCGRVGIGHTDLPELIELSYVT